MIKSIYPLVMMQLKDKIDFSFLKSKRQTILKISLAILAFAFVTALIYFAFFFARLMHIFHLADIIPVSVVVVIFTIMEILSIVSCTYGLMKNLYFSRDNQVLLTLPVTQNQVFFSKIIVYFIYELKKNLFFFVPLFLAYGLIAELPLYFIPWLLLCWVIVSLLTVSIASLLSIFAMFIATFLKNYVVIRVIAFLSIVALCIWAIVSLINQIPADFDLVAMWGKLFWDIQYFLRDFTADFMLFNFLTQFIVGIQRGILPVLFSEYTLWTFLGILGTILLMFGLAYLISRPLFFKMAAKPFEYRKVTLEKHLKNKSSNPFISAVKVQTLNILRSSDDLFNLMGCALAMPILILLLNRIFAAMSTRLEGAYMTIAFNMLIMLLIALATNARIASIYSREGAAAYLNKTRPNEYRTNLFAKLVPQAFVMVLSIITSVCIFANFTILNPLNITMFGFSVVFIYLMHMFWSAEMDIMNPQSNQYATTGTHVNNPNESKSNVTMLFVAFVFSFISYFLSEEDIKVAWIKIGILSLVFLGYRVWSYLSKIKYYYKEK